MFIDPDEFDKNVQTAHQQDMEELREIVQINMKEGKPSFSGATVRGKFNQIATKSELSRKAVILDLDETGYAVQETFFGYTIVWTIKRKTEVRVLK